MKIDITIRDVDPHLDQPSDIAALFHNHPGAPQDEVAELRATCDALTQQMIKAENEANNLADENWELTRRAEALVAELTRRVEALVAELAESELHASKLEKHNLALQSANTALRTRTLKTRADIPEVGETVDVITEAVMKALPIGARFRDGDGDVLQKGDEHGMHWVGGIGKYFTDLSSFSPFTRITNAEDQEAQ